MKSSPRLLKKRQSAHWGRRQKAALRSHSPTVETLEVRSLLSGTGGVDDSSGWEVAPFGDNSLVSTTAAPLAPVAADNTNVTVRNPQSKVWQRGSDWFAVFDGPALGSDPAGTYIWKLVGTAWVQGPIVINKQQMADVKPVGNADTVYAALYGSGKIQLVKLEYLASFGGNSNYNNYILTSTTSVTLSSSGTDTATIDIDSHGHMWVAYDTSNTVEVRYSLSAPYTTWSAPVVLANTSSSDRDITSVIAFDNKIGVMWSNHSTREWGFRYHNDSDDANTSQLTSWSADERPGATTDPTHNHNVGNGMADDHLNLKASADGTIYAAIKTAYDVGTKANPEEALLVRSPNGTWGPVYGIDGNGTRQIIELNETAGFLRYIYAGETGINDIVYKDIPFAAIDPSQPDKFYSGNDFANPAYPRQTLIGGGNNKMVSGTKQSIGSTLVVIATRTAGTPYSTSEGVAPFFVVGAKMTDVGQYLFYNNSEFDGHSTAASPADDAAIATDKVCVRGGTASFANYSSYSRGINGIIVDLPSSAAGLAASNFSFRMGNDNSPAGWATAPDPSSISVRMGAGGGGANRVTLIWPDGALKNTWLQLTILPSAATGLTQPYVFYFGNAVAESGNSPGSAVTNASDEIGARNHPQTFLDLAAVDNLYDYDHDRLVNATDQILARSNLTTLATALKLISVPSSLQLMAAGSPAALLNDSSSASDRVALGLTLANYGRQVQPDQVSSRAVTAGSPPICQQIGEDYGRNHSLAILQYVARRASTSPMRVPAEKQLIEPIAADLIFAQV